ncbi:sensor histidine kinase [Mycobacteroides abscessus]|uniref:sensor histidine kinase n=1 Tax=Mycobacteroides abscessus TaxID=36809 RepID=UPI00266B3D9D|nr:HAMP domain-containing sensor histidine kinase [Mycobacteroides abscessus]MDO2970928.1 ATP-binding protein [Mycobacteroides abscessus subsp. bolletii]MDO3078313.1 ATP-binding protein [Mycobacteroides abscessus subsp. bolletii]
MCSEQRVNTFFRYARPRKWSLRARLLAVQVTLLAFVCVGVGAGTLLATNRYLNQQLDQQLRDASGRSVVLFELGRPARESNWWRPRGPGPDFLDAPGQSIAMIGAVAADGRVTEAAVITASGERERLTTAAYQQLESLPLSQPSTVDLDALGHYRILAVPTDSSIVIITGLPAEGVDNTLLSVFGIFCAVGAAALIMAVTAGVLITRRQLAPLSQVANAAQDVADMELQRGEVSLPTPIVEVDPDRAHTEIGQLGAALNQMLDRIAAALSARHISETRIRQFVADASHELRTPLTAIRGYAELAQRNRDAVPSDVAHAMARVQSEATRMTALVEDLLLLARLDSGRALVQEPVDLSRLIVDAVSDAHIAAPEHYWSLDLPEEPVMVTGDNMRLHQVAANLLSNCRVHTPPGTTVTVSLAYSDATTYLVVADNGPGIPAECRSEIFERFARGDTSRSRRAGSTGLGLAIAAAIVSAHHGTIRVDSIPGATAFTVTLPR